MVALKPKKGRLLIAEPTILNDSSFKRTIILLTEHTSKSSVGFILNRPLQHTLNDLVPEIDCDFRVYQGGPVEQDNLYFIHKVPQLIPNSIEVANGIYWGGNFENLKELLVENKLKPTDIRFFLGYSGWETNQLIDELNIDSWFISENDYKNILTTNNESFWKNKLLQKGGKYKIWANAPSDIQMN
ncbi:YqgE/AlgH family protein [Tenacibaculum finnmarkense genomovar finnmarkense]|uniref:Transcriptional regulator n=2 Tax=Tenacibaculum finnmarkense TaxID=2781243 RepID=A0A2I2MBS8_9FLAO|nr:YqgE/AlgH family protein [Tenacibaculum finnmarkense]MBE7653013.1 YqgE/AlgH family protein [Tenacibaculum finnmarkense genomovar finnmarkense]MBE7660951.1 YqgE/AlgH family protein [Tenacibaculum finnmarkense genomovar finnmarkense]MBE7693288.1 YqgE/AlgH family protein [Tenacibaculum finnmarkense genomovar finnmarkense]MBE7695314.1 YqgE/AlgH family protein [Tenacibaculum finnmarkense genomovar finnmarkense]MBE7698330.1 YqgE/AlgH family protein [Tenacibaculum finnmarkense genomovar ulcerans]